MNIGLLFDVFEKAQEGDAASQCRLGKCFWHGESVNINYQNAIFWFLKAAEQGNIESQYYMGLSYYLGYGFEQDYVKAIDWFTKAAEEGHDEAQIKLYSIYDKGEGVEQDLQKAVYWVKRAAEQRSLHSGLLALYYWETKDYEKALFEAVKALELQTENLDTIDFEDNYTKAIRKFLYNLIAYAYKHEINLKMDVSKASDWEIEAGKI